MVTRPTEKAMGALRSRRNFDKLSFVYGIANFVDQPPRVRFEGSGTISESAVLCPNVVYSSAFTLRTRALAALHCTQTMKVRLHNAYLPLSIICARCKARRYVEKLAINFMYLLHSKAGKFFCESYSASPLKC